MYFETVPLTASSVYQFFEKKTIKISANNDCNKYCMVRLLSFFPQLSSHHYCRRHASNTGQAVLEQLNELEDNFTP